MYSLAIYIYSFCAHVAAIFNRKARLLVKGHLNTWKILTDKLQYGQKYIWFHAASLGEFEQGRVLMEKIRTACPQYKILLTFFSPSGYEVRKDYEGADIVCYLPFDTYLNARKFVGWVKPCMAFFIKYEFWQNYLTQLRQHNVPTYSVASIFRPNQIFFRSYGKAYSKVLNCFTRFYVQNQVSKDLLAQKGITDVSIVGDTRFDRVIQIRNRAKDIPFVATFVKSGQNAAVPQTSMLVAGSTWPPDEDIIINYFNRHPEQRLILAPHVVSDSHLVEIERKLQRPSLRYSQAKATIALQDIDCLIVDCYGLLSSIYRYADIAYVGGGFGAGIHNVPEAAVYGVPVIIGPNNKKFQEAQVLLQLGGVFQINTADDYDSLMSQFVDDENCRRQAGKIAQNYIQKDGGAVEKIFLDVFGNKISKKDN